MSHKIAHVSIKGKRPILLNRFTEDAISLERKERTGKAGNDPEEWKRTVMATENGQLYIQPTYIFGCLTRACSFIGGKRTLGSELASTLIVLDDIIPIKNRFLPTEITRDEKEPVYLDVRGVRNPGSKAGARNVRYRVAASKGWEMDFSLVWDSTIVGTQLLKSILRDAGNLVGLADARKIGFGRFEVIGFEESAYAEESSA